MNKTTILDGIIVPLATPQSKPGVPNIEHLNNLIDHVLDKDVDGIFILGTTGEGPSFSYSHQCSIIEETCRHVGGRTKIFVGVMNTLLEESINLSEIASDNHVDSIVLAAPYYPISQEKILEYAQAFIKQCPLPVCFYNRPGQEDIVFKIDIIKKLFIYDNVAGIKDSSKDMEYFKELIKLKNVRPGWSVSMGFEHLVAEAIPLGANGGVTGGANLFPGLYVKLYHAALQNNKADLHRLQRIVESIVSNIYDPDYLTGLKYALSCKDLCSEILADPNQKISFDQKQMIDSFFKSFNERSI